MDIDRSARVSGRPAIPPFQGVGSAIRLSLGKLVVNLVQVVKRTNTPPTKTSTVLAVTQLEIALLAYFC